MEIDLSRIKDCHKTIAFIPNHESQSFKILKIYSHVEKEFPEKHMFLLQPHRKICPNILPFYDFYIIFSETCNLHQFDQENHILIQDTQMDKTTNNAKISDHTSFLISRLSKIEKIKDKKIFGIFFCSKTFLPLARNIRKFLNEHGKISYLIYLNDVTAERLTCVDFIEVIVLINCPVLFDYNMDVYKSVVTPFDIQLAFSDDEWDGEYEANRFEPKMVVGNEIVVIENKIDVLRNEIASKEIICVPYGDNDRNMKISDGKKGMASKYEGEV